MTTKQESAAINWCFTAFDLTEIQFNEDEMQYLVYQKEKSPQTGKEHYQGFVQLKTKKRLAGVKQLFPDKAAHYEKTRGTAKQAAEYCKKEESRVDGPFEHGIMITKGQRSDLNEIVEKIQGGVPLHQIKKDHGSTWIRNYRGIKDYASDFTPKRTWKTEVFILWGPPGVGKTKFVTDNEPSLFIKSDPKWWCGYDGQEAVLIDDVVWPYHSDDNFTLDEMSRRMVLQLFDRYDYNVAVKGGSVRFNSKRIYLTSNKDPNKWLESQPAVKRRITKIIHFEVGPKCQSAKDGQVILPAHPSRDEKTVGRKTSNFFFFYLRETTNNNYQRDREQKQKKTLYILNKNLFNILKTQIILRRYIIGIGRRSGRPCKFKSIMRGRSLKTIYPEA